jgi:hypothetical protein
MYNSLLAGFSTGALIGMRSKSAGDDRHGRLLTGSERTFPAVVGTGLFVGGAMAVLEFTGGIAFNTGMTPEERQEYKEEHRRRFRRPYQEMVNCIGEGRGTGSAVYVPE